MQFKSFGWLRSFDWMVRTWRTSWFSASGLLDAQPPPQFRSIGAWLYPSQDLTQKWVNQKKELQVRFSCGVGDFAWGLYCGARPLWFSITVQRFGGFREIETSCRCCAEFAEGRRNARYLSKNCSKSCARAENRRVSGVLHRFEP